MLIFNYCMRSAKWVSWPAKAHFWNTIHLGQKSKHRDCLASSTFKPVGPLAQLLCAALCSTQPFSASCGLYVSYLAMDRLLILAMYQCPIADQKLKRKPSLSSTRSCDMCAKRGYRESHSANTRDGTGSVELPPLCHSRACMCSCIIENQ